MQADTIHEFLDRLNKPTEVSIHWLLDDCYLIAGTERLAFPRGNATEVGQLLGRRGYQLISTDIDPRGGMEGELIYSLGK